MSIVSYIVATHTVLVVVYNNEYEIWLCSCTERNDNICTKLKNTSNNIYIYKLS
jgi:hypothetical protein